MQQMRANEACARLGKDPEGVHQFRIGLRRLRVLVDAYGRYMAPDLLSHLGVELRWLNEQSGPARDWDVLILKSLQPMHERLSDDPTIRSLLHTAESARARSYAALRRTLDRPRYAELLRRLDVALTKSTWTAGPEEDARVDAPVADLARRMLKRQRRKLFAFPGRRDATDEEMHRARIAAKKLRYLTEFFRDLYPKRPADNLLRALTSFQDCLGGLNDAAVGRQLATTLANRLAGSGDPLAAGQAVGLLHGWQAARAAQALVEFEPRWAELRRAAASLKIRRAARAA
jgi:CHAD domain-containing protein